MIGFSEGLANRGLLIDVLLNKLEDGYVEHIEFDGQVCTRGVNVQSVFVVNQNHLRLKVRAQPLQCRFKRRIGVEFDHTSLAAKIPESLVN